VTPTDKNNEPLDAILRRAMRAEPGPATPECADAESMAAYSDRSIAAAERERLEAHFADCMRCQVMLADIARADESARVVKAASEFSWYRRWRIAIPALATVAAVLVFIAIRRPANEEPQRDQVAAIEKQKAPQMELAEGAPAPPAQLVAPASPAAAPASAPASVQAPPTSNEVAMNEPKLAAAPRAEARGGMALHRMESVPGPRAMFAQGNESAAKSGTVGSFSASVAGNAASSNAEDAKEARVPVTIYPPDRSVSWIIGKNGLVQRRDADGTTQIQHSGVSTDLVAGASSSASVCWIVGRSGTIIRTTDGEHWELIGSPSTENLTAVSASSAHDVAITTASGQSFTTSDGGVTWRQQ
jgi:hypothetical protein